MPRHGIGDRGHSREPRRTSAYISSGTWSLVGALLDRPCNTEQAFAKDFTNQGAVAGQVSFHKNVNGMWLLRQCIEHWNGAWTVPELIAQAEGLAPPDQVFDVDQEDLMLPGDVPARINEQRRQAGCSLQLQEAPAFTSLILHSLAARYAEVLRDVVEVTGKPSAPALYRRWWQPQRVCSTGSPSRPPDLRSIVATWRAPPLATSPSSWRSLRAKPR